MAGRIDRLRRRISIKKRTRSTATPDTETVPVSVEHEDDGIPIIPREPLFAIASKEDGNAEPGPAIPSGEEGLQATAVHSAVTPILKAERKGASQQQLSVISPKEESVELLSTVNYFEPSVEEKDGDAHTTACEILTRSEPPQHIAEDKSSDDFGYIQFNFDDMDDVSDIENPDQLPLNEETSKNLVCFQGLCHATTGNHSSDEMDNDIISLPHLTVVTPEDGGKSKEKNDFIRRSSHKTFCSIGDAYNDIIQTLSGNMKECGLNETCVTLDEIRNGLFQ